MPVSRKPDLVALSFQFLGSLGLGLIWGSFLEVLPTESLEFYRTNEQHYSNLLKSGRVLSLKVRICPFSTKFLQTYILGLCRWGVRSDSCPPKSTDFLDFGQSSQNTYGRSLSGRGLAMACLNINSLVSHIDDLRTIFINQSKGIDILAINETELDSTIKDKEVHLPGYYVTRKDRESNGRHGGGVCIYV